MPETSRETRMRGIKAVTLVTICIVLLGCGGSDSLTPEESDDGSSAVAQTEVVSPPPADLPDGQMTARRTQMWVASCALCHVDGNAFAPRVGNAEEWLPRLAKGGDVLLANTIEGVNAMPPLGYCMACEQDDFAAMIDFMTANLVSGEVQ